MTRARPLADLLALFIGPSVWFAHFAFMYGIEAVICRGFAGGSAMIWIGASASLAALAALVVLAVMIVRRRLAWQRSTDHASADFVCAVGLLLALVSMLGVVWTAFPIALLPACASPAG